MAGWLTTPSPRSSKQERSCWLPAMPSLAPATPNKMPAPYWMRLAKLLVSKYCESVNGGSVPLSHFEVV